MSGRDTHRIIASGRGALPCARVAVRRWDAVTNPSLNPSLVGFRRMTLDDLPLMHRWLHTPHVRDWWDEDGGPPAYETVVEKYTPAIRGEEPTDAYLICYDGQPIGYIQTYLIRAYPEYAAAIAVEDDAAGVDLFIGEADYLHKGLGSHILRAFLREIVFGASNAGSYIIGPSVRNTSAIRAYEKAGFRYLKTVAVPDEPEPEYLMRMTPADLRERADN